MARGEGRVGGCGWAWRRPAARSARRARAQASDGSSVSSRRPLLAAATGADVQREARQRREKAGEGVGCSYRRCICCWVQGWRRQERRGEGVKKKRERERVVMVCAVRSFQWQAPHLQSAASKALRAERPMRCACLARRGCVSSLVYECVCGVCVGEGLHVRT